MALKRLFIGVPIPDLHFQKLEAFQQAYQHLQGWRWTRPDTWHVTVYFFGPVPEEMLPNLKALIFLLLQKQESFSLTFDRYMGAPRPQDTRLIWARFEKHPRFKELVSRLHTGFLQIQPDIQMRKSPIPHITLARKKGKEVELDDFSSIPPLPELPVTELVLWESSLQEDGVIYEELERWSLKYFGSV